MVERYLVLNQSPEYIQHGGATHRRRRIEVACRLPGGTREINYSTAFLLIDTDGHANDVAAVQLAAELTVLKDVDYSAD